MLFFGMLFFASVASALPNPEPSSGALDPGGRGQTSLTAPYMTPSPASDIAGNPALHFTLTTAQPTLLRASPRSLRLSAQDTPNIRGSADHINGSLPEHHFWDNENKLLFAAVAASRTLDYFSTLNMRRRGRDEIFLTNDIVDNHPAFAVIEAAGTAVSVGASYLFHRYHHHRLERWTSIIHASLATTGAVRNYCLKTAHP
jgi:hypothetical protein